MTSSHSPSGASSQDIGIQKASRQDSYVVDIEQKAVEDAHLTNNTVRDFVWSGVTVTVKDHKTKQQKTILDNASGYAQAGTSIPITVDCLYYRGIWLDIIVSRCVRQ